MHPYQNRSSQGAQSFEPATGQTNLRLFSNPHQRADTFLFNDYLEKRKVGAPPHIQFFSSK